MRYEEFFFTQNLLEVLSEKMELPSYLVLDNSSFEDLYDTVTKRYEQFRTSPHFYNMIDDHGYEYAVQEYVYGVKYGHV